MEKEIKYGLPPDVIPLYQTHEGDYDVITCWREKPRSIVRFYYDGTSPLPESIGDSPMYHVSEFKKL